MQTTVKLYTLDYREARTYAFAALFVVGNIVLPALFHLVPRGGMTWLPIYFFTLVGAYKYGWKVGLITAVLSPLANSLLTGMPAAAVLPVIVTKSALLALGAGFAAKYARRVSLPLLTGVVLFYQAWGTLAEWAYMGNLHLAMQDFRVGIPGMLLQIFGGYLVLRYVLRR